MWALWRDRQTLAVTFFDGLAAARKSARLTLFFKGISVRRSLICLCLVSLAACAPRGTIVVDPKKRYLYLVLGNGKAMRYGASVGKAGRTWSGAATIGRMEKWPTWTPTPEHIAEFPKLVKWQNGGMPGGPENPMGARALMPLLPRRARPGHGDQAASAGGPHNRADRR